MHSCCQEITKINHVFLEISCVFVLLFMLLRITLACQRVLLPLQLRSNLINVKSSRVACAMYEIIAGPIKSVHFECLRTRRVERKKATADVLQKWDSEVFPAHPVDRDSPCFPDDWLSSTAAMISHLYFKNLPNRKWAPSNKHHPLSL